MNNIKYLVSIVIPFYNAYDTIEQCVNSAVSAGKNLEQYINNLSHEQKYIFDLLKDINEIYQIIIVDDCSTIKNTKLEDMLQGKNISILHNEKNLGVAYTRNKGIEYSNSLYIAFLDADDYWDDKKLVKQFAVLDYKNNILCSTGRRLISKNNRLNGKYIGVKKYITYKDLLKGNTINCSSVLVRKDIIKKYPMGNDDAHEDYLTWLRILKDYDIAIGVDEPLLFYRIANNSKSGSKIHSAFMTFKTYRYMKFGILKSLYYFCWYSINGIIKYI